MIVLSSSRTNDGRTNDGRTNGSAPLWWLTIHNGYDEATVTGRQPRIFETVTWHILSNLFDILV